MAEFSRAQYLPSAASAEAGTWGILATACIAPAAFPQLQRTDPAQRLDDYRRALGELAAHPSPLLGPLVVLENSGFGAEGLCGDIMSAAGGAPVRPIEVLSYLPAPRAEGLHYGFDEFRMIDELIDQSRLLGPRFVKVTGRYRFPGIARLLAAVDTGLMFQCDAQDIPAFMGRRASRTMNASIFLADRAFYNAEIRTLYRAMDPVRDRRTHAEGLIFDHLRVRHGSGGVKLRFPLNCEPAGVGGNGEVLSRPARVAKGALRAMARRLAPSVWI